MTKESKKQGRLFIIGIGPGKVQQMTGAGQQAIQSSEVIIGYRSYIDQIEELLKHQEVISTGMGSEVERCNSAINSAKDGRQVALVCGGDPGIYGMAGLVYEILALEDMQVDFSIEVLPGVPALCAAAALLGAPIMNDFASISLSNLLTPWEVISKRLEAAAQGDFVIVLYNPKSASRTEPLFHAHQIISRYQKSTTPIGIVTNAYREKTRVVISTLDQMCNHEIDMRTIIFVGNSTSYISNNRMITPRGYANKYELYSV